MSISLVTRGVICRSKIEKQTTPKIVYVDSGSGSEYGLEKRKINIIVSNITYKKKKKKNINISVISVKEN